MLGDEDNLQCPRNVFRVLHHIGKQFTKYVLVAVVDKPIVTNDLLGEFGIRSSRMHRDFP
jgi:hypothetical protein